jgi:hypothetical protein
LERHCGYGFEALLAAWKKWVLDRGLATQHVALGDSGEAALERVLSTIQDQRALIRDRIEAVRDIGQSGHVFGAGVLIDMLRTGSDIPNEELVWALEAISGEALGANMTEWVRSWEAQSAAGPVESAASSTKIETA